MSMQFLKRPGKPSLAYVYSPPNADNHMLPPVMFCGGYRSDMGGTKATYLEEQCKIRGQAYLRFDYSGHGDSEGVFEEGGIGDWSADALDMMAHIFGDQQKIVIVGSSMGGWISLLVARARPGQIFGFVGIAAAPDFTMDMVERMSEAQRSQLEAQGYVDIPNDYSDTPYHFTKRFYDEAAAHLIFSKPLALHAPACLVQGMLDTDVPPSVAERIQRHITGTEVHVTYVEDGDHRLSRPQDLALIDQKVCAVSGL